MFDLPNTYKPRQDETAGVAEHVLTRIQEAGPCRVWSRTDFLDLGSSYAVEKALQRLVQRGRIRRVLRGLYDRPTQDPITRKWEVPPILSFVDAIARRDGLRVLVDGLTAAHALGLTSGRPFSTIVYARTRLALSRLTSAPAKVAVTCQPLTGWISGDSLRACLYCGRADLPWF